MLRRRLGMHSIHINLCVCSRAICIKYLHSLRFSQEILSPRCHGDAETSIFHLFMRLVDQKIHIAVFKEKRKITMRFKNKTSFYVARISQRCQISFTKIFYFLACFKCGHAKIINLTLCHHLRNVFVSN